MPLVKNVIVVLGKNVPPVLHILITEKASFIRFAFRMSALARDMRITSGAPL